MDAVVKMAVLIAAGGIFSSGNVSTPENALDQAVKLWSDLNAKYPDPIPPVPAVEPAPAPAVVPPVPAVEPAPALAVVTEPTKAEASSAA